MHNELALSLSRFAMERPGDLMISISGVRGRVPEGLDPLNITLFTQAFANVTGKRIVIGNDARATGEIMRNIIIGTLLACGKEILDIGLAPTPTVKAAVATFKADGGIMISASHNPPEWNAFKFIDRGGFFFGTRKFEEWKKALVSGHFPLVNYKKRGRLKVVDGVDSHIQSVLEKIPNVTQIKKMKYRVVVDGVAGAGRDALPRLLEILGCRVTKLFCEPTLDGSFPRPPEPTPQALKTFSASTKKEQAAIGFALDPDADRLVLSSPTKGAIHEEYTLPLALMGTLSTSALKDLLSGTRADGKKKKRSQSVIINLSSSFITATVAQYGGWKVERAPVGEANVVEMMRKTGAIFGGEGNGGVIHPEIPSYGRDSLAGAALILSAMAASGSGTIDTLLQRLPQIHMEKSKFPLGSRSLSEIFQKLAQLFPEGKKDERDGLHITLPDGSWIHARASNTEPIVRVIAEAGNRVRLKAILDHAGALFRS